MDTPRSTARLRVAAVVALALMDVGLARPAAAALPPLPPLESPATLERHVGKVVWVEMATPDLAVAERFYAGLFGWTFRELPASGTRYALAFADGHAVAGLIEHRPSAARGQPAWLPFFSVADVDAVAKRAVDAGGTVLSAAKDVPERGRQAVLADPESASFAVVASTSGDSPDTLPAEGTWIWSSLHAGDADADATFYQRLMGFAVFDLASEDALLHVVLSSDDYARAGVNQQPVDALHRRAYWLNFVRVPDAAATAGQAVALGGRIVVAPRRDRHGGQLAVVADAAGAVTGLMDWSDAATHAEPK
jgi:predicted enzyme related to lactoylglutathione lyase